MSSSAMDDAFGKRELRPDHPDFWRLSEIFLANDGRMDDTPPPDKERVWRETVTDVIDLNSLTYMATQRAIRVMGGPPKGMDGIMLHSKVAAAIIDAFVAGAWFERRGGHQE